MLIFLQEFVLQIFLWILQAVDSVMQLFSSLTGVGTISYKGRDINFLEYLLGDSTISKVFWCVFILAIGLSCIFAIIALIKNIIANNRNISGIVGKFFLSLLGTLAMLVVVILGILVSNAFLVLIAQIFDIDSSMNLAETIFNMCVGDWFSGYSTAEVDFATVTVRDIFGEYDANTVFGVFPTQWKMNGMVNPNTFMYLPTILITGGLGFALVKTIIKLVKRTYELIFMYVTMPMFLSTLPLDDGARFKTWRESFMTKIMLTYGTVFSVGIFAVILPMIGNMNIEGISVYGNTLFKIFMAIGGAATIPAGQALFSKIIAGENADKNGTISVREVYNVLHESVRTERISEIPGSNKYSEDSRTFELNDDSGGEFK